jgi:hypothetical protein
MKVRVVFATCAAFVMATLAVMAQTPSSSQPPSSQSLAKTMTMTGCLQRAQPAPGGTSTAAGSMQPKFVLTSISPSSSGAAGTSGTSGSSMTASEYRLDYDEAKLTPHVGHKVEITGAVVPMSSTPPPSAASASTSSSNAPTLKVDNVKMIAATCP